jgi:hypothetical protein
VVCRKLCSTRVLVIIDGKTNSLTHWSSFLHPFNRHRSLGKLGIFNLLCCHWLIITNNQNCNQCYVRGGSHSLACLQ